MLALASGLPSCAQAFTFTPGGSSLAPLPSSTRAVVATRQLTTSSAEALLWRLGTSAALVSRPQQQQQQQQRHRSLRLHNSTGLGISELEIIKRLLMATFAGAAIGFERRYSERPAGLRTMALVSLGASIFTIISLGIPGDKSRMAASVASGVGFIGAGVISQNGFEDSSKSGGRRIQQVNGLTTATAIWVSAALGVSSGAGLNLLTFIGAALAVCVLRVGRFTRLLRLRRRDFANLTEKTKKALNFKPSAPSSSSSSSTPSSGSSSFTPHPAPPSTQQTLLVAGGAGGSSTLHSPPQSDSPFLVRTKAVAAAATAAATAAAAAATSSRKKRGQLRGGEEEEDDEENTLGNLGSSKFAIGVPPPSDLYETTKAGGLGSQQMNFGGGEGGAGGDMGGGGGMMFSSGGSGGDGEGPQFSAGGDLGFGDATLGGGGA